MKILEMNQLSFYYGPDRPGVENLTDKIKSGSIYGLIGPNGSGKTTLLKLITNLLSPSSGAIKFFERFEKFKDARDYIGFVPDTESVWNNLTAKEFITYICQLFNKNITELKKKMDLWLEIFSLKGRENELLENYSFGMKKKVQIIATILHDPLLLILDEPIFGLDPESIVILFITLQKYVKTPRVFDSLKNPSSNMEIFPSVLFATHQLEYVEKYCDQLMLISNANIIMSNDTQTILKNLNSTDLHSAFIRANKRFEAVEEKIKLIDDVFQ